MRVWYMGSWELTCIVNMGRHGISESRPSAKGSRQNMERGNWNMVTNAWSPLTPRCLLWVRRLVDCPWLTVLVRLVRLTVLVAWSA